MALSKLSPVLLLAALQKKIEEQTGKKCYDAVPKNAKSPFYFAEILRIQPDNTKTMWRDVYTANVHCIAAPSKSSVGIFALIDQLEEALTSNIRLPNGYHVILQQSGGVQSIKTDETEEKHAILTLTIAVCYGFKVKI